jgi:hypothetical protein
VITPGDPVRLDLARGRVDRVRQGPRYPVAEVTWTTGARCPVPVSWLTPITVAEAALTESAWARRGREVRQGYRDKGSRAEDRERAREEPRRIGTRLGRRLPGQVEHELNAPLEVDGPYGRQLQFREVE